jgi:hypothetical protein
MEETILHRTQSVARRVEWVSRMHHGCMTVPTALLCAISAAALAAGAPDPHYGTADVPFAAPTQDTVARRPHSDTTARKNPPPQRRKPTRTLRYCPACGMG